MKYLFPLTFIAFLAIYSPLVFQFKGDWWIDLENSAVESQLVTSSFACVIAVAVPMSFDWVLDIYNLYFRDVKELTSVHLSLRLLALAVLLWPALHYLSFDSGVKAKYIICDYVAQKYFVMVLSLTLLNELETAQWMKRCHASAVVLMTIGVVFSVLLISTDDTKGTLIANLQMVVFSAYFTLQSLQLIYFLKEAYVDKKENKGTILFTSIFLVQGLFLVFLRRASCMPGGHLDFQKVVAFSNFSTVVLCTIPTIMPGRVGRENFRDSKRINEFRQSFMRYISHEIRTPLNVSTVGVAIMEDTLTTSGNLNGELSQIMEQTKKALSIATEILNDLLTFEKLTMNVMTLEKTLQRPVEYLLGVINLFEFQAREKQIALELPMDDPALRNCFVFIDTYKMSQVIRNLISNALKFTPQCGTISVTSRIVLLDIVPSSTDSMRTAVSRGTVPSSEWLRISVRDTGAGIAPENICKLFKEVVQFDSNRLQQGGGSGLGMYISRGIVDLHGGIISVTSEGLDKGSVFSIDLPLIRVEEPVAINEADNVPVAIGTAVDNRTSFPCFDSRLDDIPECPQESTHTTEGQLPRRNNLVHMQTEKSDLTLDFSQLPKNDTVVPITPNMTVAHFSSADSVLTPTGVASSSGISLKNPMASIKHILGIGKTSDNEESKSESCHNISSVPSVSVARGRNGSVGSVPSINILTPRSQCAVIPPNIYSDIETGKISLPASSSAPQTQLSTLDLRDYRILVVDDSNMNLKIMTLMIKKFGAECITATNGDQAFKIVAASLVDDKSKIDMVVMDNHMDVMCGPVACKLMRSAGYTGPIFGLTGEVNAASDNEYITAGADFIFRKPLNIKEVVDKFTSIFVR